MRIPRSFWLTALCVATLGGCAQTRQLVHNPFSRAAQKQSIQYDLAQVAEREGQLRHAAEQYRELHAKHPTDVQYIHRLGVVELRLGNRDEGLELLELASKMAPKDPQMLNDLGYGYLELGELERADEKFRAALSYDPNNRRTLNNLGLCAGFAGHFDEAYEYFRRVGTEAEAQANVAYVLAQRGELPQAMDRYSRALTIDPQLKPAAEALVQLTPISREADAKIQLAKATATAEQNRVEQAAATTLAELPPSPDDISRRSVPAAVMGLSAP